MACSDYQRHFAQTIVYISPKSTPIIVHASGGRCGRPLVLSDGRETLRVVLTVWTRLVFECYIPKLNPEGGAYPEIFWC